MANKSRVTKVLLVLMFVLLATAVSATIQNQNVVVYYTFDDADVVGGLAQDISAIYTPDYSMDTNDAVTGVSGILLQAFNYSDQTQQKSTSTMDAIGPGSNYTVAMWIMLNETSELDYIWVASDTSKYLYLANDAGNKFKMGQYDGAWKEISGPTNTVANQWYFVAMTYNETSGNLSLWLNAELEASISATGVSVAQGGFILGRNPGNPEYFSGRIDEMSIWNVSLSAGDLSAIYNGGNGVQFPFAETSPPINLSGFAPENETQYNFQSLDLNITINSSVLYNVTLWINGTENLTVEDQPAGQGVFHNFTLDFLTGQAYTYLFQIHSKEYEVNTTIRTFFIDSVEPEIITPSDFNNGTVFLFNTNITTFNFSDDFLLFSYNITLNGIEIFGLNDIFLREVSVPTYFNPTVLNIGNHTLITRTADGHTAKTLKGNYTIKKGLFKNKLGFGLYDGKEVWIEQKGFGLTDKFTATKKKDRYTFGFNPQSNGKTSYTFKVDYEEDIYIAPDNDKYGQYLVVGEHWLDFVLPDHPDSVVDIVQIDPNSVEVTVSGLTPGVPLEFDSIGDLNIVTHHFDLTVTNSTNTYSNPVNELFVQTIQFNITQVPEMTLTNATLLYNGTFIASTKTTSGGVDSYTSTFVTPLINTGATEIRNVTWHYVIDSVGGQEIGDLNFTQNVSQILVDNCSSFSIRAYNITIINETSDIRMNGTLEGNFIVYPSNTANSKIFNLSWPSGGTGQKDASGSDNSYGICINSHEDSFITTAQMEYEAPGYSKKLYFFNNASINNITKLLNLYLTLGTTQVKFTVTDFNDNPQPNTIIKILSYDIATDTSKVTEVLKTDSDGNAWGQIILNTQEYKFIIEQEGVIKLETDNTIIDSLTKKFRIGLGSNFFETFNKIGDVSGNVVWTNNTLTFDYTWNDVSGTATQACLEVVRTSITGKEVLTTGANCNVAAAGNLAFTLPAPVGTATYVATGYIVIDGILTPIDTESVSFDYGALEFGLMGLFVTFLIILFLVMFGMWNPKVSVLLAVIAIIISRILGVIYLGWGATIGIIIMGVIVLIKSKN